MLREITRQFFLLWTLAKQFRGLSLGIMSQASFWNLYWAGEAGGK